MQSQSRHERTARLPGGAIPLFGATIFLGAFLLFLVQPLMAKFILPWYGGSPAVWTTCMLFFQSFLLLGYCYAHVLTSRFALNVQVAVHAVLLAVALLLLPIIPGEEWKPVGSGHPVAGILGLLTVTLGLPYSLLAATSPLLQRWFTMLAPNVLPYRFFALSNVGSFLALLGYPFLIEPLVTRNAQAGLWSWGLGAFAAVCLGCAALVMKSGAGKNAPAPAAPESEPLPGREKRIFWLAFPTLGSVMLLSVTNKLCQDIAVVPFLWIAPLLLYLLTFVICFDRPKWYSRPLFGGFFILSCGVVSVIPFWRSDPPVMLSLVAHLALLFSACMLCHGETYRMRPSVGHLTMYYLTIAAGGALGGVLVVLAAPALLSDYGELTMGTLATGLAFLFVLYRDAKSPLREGRPRWAWVALAVLALAYGVVQQGIRSRERQFTIASTRNFYGTLKVAEYDASRPNALHRTMRHGAILHGLQYFAPRYQVLPTAYYTEKSGVGYCFRYYPSRQNRKIGVVGLGVGTLAAWGLPGDTVRFYEINPAVKDLAGRHFTYLKNSPAVLDVVEGDARLSLEREGAQEFDILVLDAFNSDSPPVHLLTREAFAIYRRHLKPDGVLAINVTCKYLNFFPVVARMADEYGYRWAYIFDPNAEDAFYRSSSTWVVLTRNEQLLENADFVSVCTLPRTPYKSTPLWSDDYAPLASLLVW